MIGTRVLLGMLLVGGIASAGVLEGAAIPVDVDADGLGDERKIARGTDPTVADTDGDGLDDAVELAEYGTEPTATDTDADGLDDGSEVYEYGTDPLDPDTDRDGIPDGAEVHLDDVYPGADPLRTDVYVEVDVMAGTGFDEDSVRNIETAFERAPIDVRIHFVFSDTVPPDPAFDVESDFETYPDRYRDYDGYGHYYLLVTHNLESCNCVGKIGEGKPEIMAVERYEYTDNTIMHELGHAMGLYQYVFDGVDSHEYAYEEYPSVMNYNRERTDFSFSDGTASPKDFDDWRFIEHNRTIPDTSKVDATAGYTDGGAGVRDDPENDSAWSDPVADHGDRR